MIIVITIAITDNYIYLLVPYEGFINGGTPKWMLDHGRSFFNG